LSAFELNRLAYELGRPDVSDAYRANQDLVLERYRLTPAERVLVTEFDFIGLVEAGVNPYLLGHIGRIAGLSFADIGALMRGETPEQMGAFLAEQSARIAEFAIFPEEVARG
jgi:hypothetical protein